MAQYQKKPVIVEAFCLGIDPMPEWFCDARSQHKIITHGDDDHLVSCDIVTLEGVMKGVRGTYIIQGVQGEMYPCKEAIFRLTYEPVGDAASSAA